MNMKKIFTIAVLALAAMPMAAQETYENANIATEDLNGTARYVGMGGAMEALGADISTIGTNPAGIGLFRHTMASTSLSGLELQDAEDFSIGKKTKVSFDQIGFVYAHRSGERSFLNFAFNYHKSRNFNDLTDVSDRLDRASQNKLSFNKWDAQYFDLDFGNTITGNSNAFSQVDYLYFNAFLSDDEDNLFFNDANSYLMRKASKGHIGEYDFNLSGNINDRVYLGLTLGIKDVNYKSYSEYTESLLDYNNKGIGSTTLADERRIDGSGFDIKAGIIFRPVETSPFRVGLYVNTPTWYDLKTSNYTELINNTNVGLYKSFNSSEVYEYKLYTPWKFGASLGHTVGNWLALGLTYEYADYSNLDSRYNTGGTYDWYYDNYYEDSESDYVMNNHTESTLKGVHTLKIGGEYMLDNDLSLRVGFNYLSPMFSKDGFKNSSLDSPGSYYASATDYTNWKSTTRVTIGAGYRFGKMSVDFAYQYSQKNGDFSPFMSYEYPPEQVVNLQPEDFYSDGTPIYDNFCFAKKLNKERHQLLFTLGYHF